jgi:hypothetical protein
MLHERVDLVLLLRSLQWCWCCCWGGCHSTPGLLLAREAGLPQLLLDHGQLRGAEGRQGFLDRLLGNAGVDAARCRWQQLLGNILEC